MKVDLCPKSWKNAQSTQYFKPSRRDKGKNESFKGYLLGCLFYISFDNSLDHIFNYFTNLKKGNLATFQIKNKDKNK